MSSGEKFGDQPAKLLFVYTPGGHEGTLIEIGDDPRDGEQAPLWGPEQYAQAVDSLVRFNVTLLPEEAHQPAPRSQVPQKVW